METRVTPEQEDIKRAREEIQKRTGKTPEQLYDEREKRMRDAIQLKEPDRVPVVLRLDNFILRYGGLSLSAQFYEPAAYRQAVIKTLLDFEPDVRQGPPTNIANSGPALEALDSKQHRWPGGPIPPDIMNQFVPGEYMKEDEYDLFITDPTDFMQRCYLPRAFGALAPLSKLPYLIDRAVDFPNMIPIFTSPEFQKMAQTLLKVGPEQEKFNQVWRGFEDAMASLGFPTLRYPGGVGSEPYDLFASHLRGLEGVTFDMYRRPEKLLAACEKVLEWRLARAKPADPSARGYPRPVQGGAFHFSSDRFLSKKQFATFSWPNWKKALLATIDMGFIPVPFGEGTINERLEFFLELPKGKFFIRFADVDMARAKAMLGNHCCLCGNVPSSLMEVSSPQEVEEYCRNLIKVGGKGGGFMLACNSGLDDAKPANVKAMIDSAKKYGRY
ncbi:MAG: hypothetical protein HYX85_01725 [Chloroflexi bacterium]|nr:hypothetical protein [Chloroflexota bacterium]